MRSTPSAKRRFASLLALACFMLAAIATPASAALPRTYTAQVIDSPIPTQAAGFGGGLAAIGDLNGDGSADFVVGQGAGSPGAAGQVFIYSGATGPCSTRSSPRSRRRRPSALFGLPFSDRLPDIGSCPAGPTASSARTRSGPRTAFPRSSWARAASTPAALTDVGRAYVYDGATRALMKRIDLPAARPDADGDLVRRHVVRARRLLARRPPPCAGDLGVGACPPSSGAMPGDVDGGGQPDIFVGASRFTESPATAQPGSHCAGAAPAATCISAGRAYLYRGEDVAVPIRASRSRRAARTFKNPGGQADDPFVFDVTARRELFGNAITAVGDVGSCTAPASSRASRARPPASRRRATCAPRSSSRASASTSP